MKRKENDSNEDIPFQDCREQQMIYNSEASVSEIDITIRIQFQ
jgi:hypothetical protein